MRLAALAFGALFATEANAQHNTNTPQFAYGGAATFTLRLPFNYPNQTWKKVQMIYRPGIFVSPSGAQPTAGTIYRVYFRNPPAPSGGDTYIMKKVSIKLKQVTDTAYVKPAGIDPKAPFITGTTEVFSEASYTVSTPGWIEFALKTPFVYDPTKSLVVEATGDNGFNASYVARENTVIAGELTATEGNVISFNNLNEFGFDFTRFPTAIQNVNAQTEVTVFPNPAVEDVRFSFSDNVRGMLVVTDMNGRVVLNEQVNGNTHVADISAFANGLYLYKVINAEQVPVATGKLTVTH